MQSCLVMVNQSGSWLLTVVQLSGVQKLSRCTHNIRNCSARVMAKSLTKSVNVMLRQDIELHLHCSGE